MLMQKTVRLSIYKIISDFVFNLSGPVIRLWQKLLSKLALIESVSKRVYIFSRFIISHHVLRFNKVLKWVRYCCLPYVNLMFFS